MRAEWCLTRTIVVLAILAAEAHGALFSFASLPPGFTQIIGAGDSFSTPDNTPMPVFLAIDDEMGLLPPMFIEGEIQADFVIEHVSSIPVSPSAVMHTYTLQGVLEFVASGASAPLLTVTVERGSFTVIGVGGGWGSAGSGLSSDFSAQSVVYLWHGNCLPGYGLAPGTPDVMADFALTFTGIGPPFGEFVLLDPGTGLPLFRWSSGMAYSGFAQFPDCAPCPGDTNNDQLVDVDDLNAILSAWLTGVGVGSPLDLANDDGVIDVDDLNVVLANWLASCP